GDVGGQPLADPPYRGTGPARDPRSLPEHGSPEAPGPSAALPPGPRRPPPRPNGPSSLSPGQRPGDRSRTFGPRFHPRGYGLASPPRASPWAKGRRPFRPEDRGRPNNSSGRGC